ncbi:hypothetical protein PILCRDRAFT_93321 [Piloderma croceum F 1598]|uniref:Uncharacterized protein n=1 Tax=Piloderma croceum (strain F 1598) TaxID=765440 RepID=A0A0C3B634_PILCF|nr:hypothetical protein PILCRDRAFT_93321 [Piloderma croceum F 1598]
MPNIMKKLVKGTFGTWAAFCTAVKAVSDDEIDNAIAKEKQISAVEDESKRLQAQLQAQQSPRAPLRTTFGGFNINYLSANMKDMVHYPNTPEGQTAYQAQYKGGDKYAPYLLMPGTLSVGVGYIIRTSRNNTPTAPKPANVQYVAATPEYLAYLSQYKEEQGNGDRPMV